MNTVYISLGSNLGDREQALHDAIERMPPKINPIALSNIYETPPWGYTHQPNFLNQVIEAHTPLKHLALLEELKRIEAEMGREPNFRLGPRIIDLDILFFNRDIFVSDILSIPHKELCNRAFVLIPLLDIAPDWIHPETGETIKSIAGRMDSSSIKLFKKGQREKERTDADLG